MQGFKDFDPSKELPSLTGKVILVSGGTAGLGEHSVRAFAAHGPLHIYFTGRNASAAQALIAEIKGHASVSFDKLHLVGPCVVTLRQSSIDGYEIQFATNHLGHAMLTKLLLPQLLAAANELNSDVRIINNTSDGYEFHRAINGGISFPELESGSTMNRTVLGPWVRYGQSKLANILFASELSRRYPNITSLAIHPGLVSTPMNTENTGFHKYFVIVTSWLTRTPWLEPHQGVLNQLWCAAGAKKEDLRNGGFYRPVGVDCWDKLTPEGKDEELARRLWEFTECILAKY